MKCVSTSSGTGLMEQRCDAALKRAAMFSIGSFGDRWHEMAVSNGINADLFKSELGSITRPEMVDDVLKTESIFSYNNSNKHQRE